MLPNAHLYTSESFSEFEISVNFILISMVFSLYLSLFIYNLHDILDSEAHLDTSAATRIFILYSFSHQCFAL